MRRREFLGFFGGAAIACRVRAQESKAPIRIGMLPLGLSAATRARVPPYDREPAALLFEDVATMRAGMAKHDVGKASKEGHRRVLAANDSNSESKVNASS